MKFPDPLVPAVLLRRYKRFLADVRLADGTETTAHCANPGRMTSCMEVGGQVWLSPARSPSRKLRWTWELAEVDGTCILVNTARANAVVAEALAAKALPAFTPWPSHRAEVRYGNERSRIDFLLEGADRPPCYLEVKQVTLKTAPGEGAFPDAVSLRGQKHLRELAAQVDEGHEAALFFLVARGDVQRVRPADEVDPDYGRAFREAVAAGVAVHAWGLHASPDGLELDRELTVTVDAPG